MKLPEIHRTARYKSLPEGLKAKADAIIKKKFGIKEEKVTKTKKPATESKVYAFNAMDDLARIDLELRQRPAYYHVSYSIDMREFRVEYECPDCHLRDVKRFSDRELPAREDRHHVVFGCARCGIRMPTVISGRDLHDAARRAESSKRDMDWMSFNPMHDFRF